MFIGKWNKSVILTYVGLASAVVGMISCFNSKILTALGCLVISGVCDMFDGKIARMCKRNKKEIEFGIQLDSLVDVFNFIAYPIVIFISLGLTNWYNMLIYVAFGICGVARLANFNIEAEETTGPVKCYKGLPVTSSAIIFPVLYLLKFIMPINIFDIVFGLSMLVVAFLYIYNFKVFKPKGKWYYIFSIGAIAIIIIYLIIK